MSFARLFPALVMLIMLSMLGAGGWFITTHSYSALHPSLRIAITPWPSFELLALGVEKGYFKQQGIDLELVELSTSTDAVAAYERNQVDGIADYLGVVAENQIYAKRNSHILVITDSTIGSDVILAKQGIANMQGLLGKRIALEVYPLGRYVLYRALQIHGIQLSDVILRPGEQERFIERMRQDEVDAAVTYSPYTEQIRAAISTTTIFNSTEIPNEVFDVVAVDEATVKRIPNLGPALRAGFTQALEYARAHPQEFAQFVAKREEISPQDATQALSLIHIYSAAEQEDLVRTNALALPWQRMVETIINESDRKFVQSLVYFLKPADWSRAP